jgi:hypothetical protein
VSRQAKTPTRPEAVPDPKAALEERLVHDAMAPWEAVLDEDQRAAMEWALDLLVTTHPAMQRAIEERAKRDVLAAPRPESRDEPCAVQASGFVLKDEEDHAPEQEAAGAGQWKGGRRS